MARRNYLHRHPAASRAHVLSNRTVSLQLGTSSAPNSNGRLRTVILDRTLHPDWKG